MPCTLSSHAHYEAPNMRFQTCWGSFSLTYLNSTLRSLSTYEQSRAADLNNLKKENRLKLAKLYYLAASPMLPGGSDAHILCWAMLSHSRLESRP